MTSTLRRGGERGIGEIKMRCSRMQWGRGGRGRGKAGGRVRECYGRPIFIFFIKENWICAMTRHQAEPNINILLTRNLPFDSDFRQWSHPSMIPLHCLWAKSNNRTRGQFECDATWFWFRSLICTVRLLFHSLFTFSICANKAGWLQDE